MKAHLEKCIDAWFIPGWKMVFSCAKWITKPGTVRRVWWNIWFCWSRPSPGIYSCSTHREGPAERCQTDRPRCFCSCVPVTDARTGSGMTCSDPWQLRVDVRVDVRAHPAGDGEFQPARGPSWMLHSGFLAIHMFNFEFLNGESRVWPHLSRLLLWLRHGLWAVFFCIPF